MSPRRVNSPKENPKPENHGHRGARGLYPENSLTAIEAAIDIGCDAVEVDLCVTADNRLVIHHDLILSRHLVRDERLDWISKEIKIRQTSLSELKKYDVGRIRPGSDYSGLFPCQTAVDGARIPALKEFVGLVDKTGRNVIFNLELKSAPYDETTAPAVEEYVDIVCKEIKAFDIAEKTFLQSFDWRLPIRLKKIIPELKIGLLTSQRPGGGPQSPVPNRPDLWTNNLDLSDFDGAADMVQAAGGDVWSCNFRDLSAKDVDRAHDLGLEVCVWTVNSVEDMRRMIAFGVDAITTDYPDRLQKLLSE